ncbi:MULTISPECIES: acyl-CoA dehydrogenase family protein [Mycobacterium]|uniref:Acyl-CoA dehydrogenase FadE n=1 Tax=Mycobacterium kiyosense TaxID=2871094 RepID=A0A9P3UYM3_9MYCO|nr:MULTISPECIES: acyl-CoA dehydrogenase family protein [Mycobacterium]BDB43989.1 putative acyl-CoA dehydrogenase FadE [Mycobacterium kiyosense]BDE15534.1 putative acyl-CoA dehydrogenase FadE [Mycobacterium sp. 20KCMC460]GLB81042.1 putative acyl-CoA dehydrogenase FadE [Mycobacterium kiyosense]GLB87197.1 putative acyl-CoA dehydrogenase FadE [Mycobacterium kiyosense]GLB93523.1 putative acyl-CoA dehydrogenase FadE [Mycobacterium kiyosense]
MAVQTNTVMEDTVEHRAMREAVRGIVTAFGPDYYQRQVDDGGSCAELWKTLGANGYLGVHLPEQYGGGGLGVSELSIVVHEAAVAGCPMQSMLFSSGVTGTILDRSANEEQKARWLPGVASGDIRLSFAITEPDAGSNAHRISTTARREADHYVLNGQKVFITGMESAELVMVVARTMLDDATGRGRLSVFMVDRDSPGLSWTPIRTVMNQPDKSHQVFFDDVLVPAENLIGVENKGLAVAFTGLNTERILTSSLCTGIGRYALGKAVNYANDRRVWNVPIGAHQAVAHPLAAAHIHLQAAELVTDRACSLYDTGAEVGELANMAKYLGASAGLEALDAAVAVHGGNGVTYEYQLAPYFWLVRMLNMGPVSKEMILNFVAEHSLGLPRSY